MSEQTDKIIKLLEPYGLSPDESRIYLELLENGTLSALKISRNIHMGRTKVYRILDKLIAKEMVVQKSNDAGLTFIADPPAQLDLLLTKQEGELKSLRVNLPQVLKNLEFHTQTGMQGSQVLYYRGAKGLSQVNWHLLRAKGEFLSYEVDNAEAYLYKQESEDLRRRFVQENISVRELTNKSQFAPFTEVKGLIDLWELKYLPKSTLDITADVFIYNNVYAVVNYVSKNDVFCVEIYNQELADMQRQLFEYLWFGAQKFQVINDRGEAKLIT